MVKLSVDNYYVCHTTLHYIVNVIIVYCKIYVYSYSPISCICLKNKELLLLL